ncbi:piggyBac transposable element-derived protein 4-like [Nematostella vectensis]|uniref:piggyBac transposable element-derived protein 4-like n=1 Tax=Nematostella vectensis TaxID=45351 RepID=UPI00207714ED|nr:piggyBac transposable element-derived protein 4-like [Nematostella vectensis]
MRTRRRQARVKRATSEESDEEREEANAEWTYSVTEINVSPFTEDIGPTAQLPAVAGALDFFKLLFTDEIPEEIVLETNRNAAQKTRIVSDPKWYATTKDELCAYFGIRFLQGIKSVPSERHYWSKNEFLSVKKIKDVMPRDRYLKITQYLHYNNSATAKPRGHPEHDKLHLIRPLITKLGESFLVQYKPNRENAIDEGLVKFKGRLAYKQYMPMKPVKRGIKVWIRADSITHYVSRFQVYTGKPQQGQEARPRQKSCGGTFHRRN